MSITIRSGASRLVFLTRRWAIKLPAFHFGWRPFLHGLLANMLEVSFDRLNHPKLCPIRFYLPGGWLVIMPRARPLTAEEFSGLDFDEFCDEPVEAKPDSFGWLPDGSLVAVDYG